MNIPNWTALVLWELVGLAIIGRYIRNNRIDVMNFGMPPSSGLAIMLTAFVWPLVTLHVYLKRHKQIDFMDRI